MRIRRLFVLPSLLLVFGTMLVATPVTAAAAATSPASGVSAAATPDFQMTVEGDPGTNPPFRHVKRGSGAPYFVTITAVNGFTGSVALSLTGNIPANSTVTINNPTGFGPLKSGGVSIQTHKVITPTGTFDMTIHGTSGTLEHDQPIVLTVG
jgi:hypothetical protein